MVEDEEPPAAGFAIRYASSAGPEASRRYDERRRKFLEGWSKLPITWTRVDDRRGKQGKYDARQPGGLGISDQQADV